MKRVCAAIITSLLASACSIPPAPTVKQASASPVLDCPLRDMPFSADSPLMDLLLNDEAKAIVEAVIGPVDKMPANFVSSEAPSFSAILTLSKMRYFGEIDEAKIQAADAALRLLPVTDDDRVKRCARYDDDKVDFALPNNGQPNILIFEKMTGFRDGPSVESARDHLLAMAAENGWNAVVTEKGGAIDPQTLAQFDVVIWNNVSGDVLTMTQRQNLQDYVEGGGGFVALHGSAGDPVYYWDWYVDTLIGARFAGHPRNPQFQEARITIENNGHPVAAALPSEWKMLDEWYSFSTNPRAAGATVIATLDEGSYNLKDQSGMQLEMGDHPIAWVNEIGKGRMFYSAIGHRPEVYGEPTYQIMYQNAIKWVGHIDD